MTLSSLARGGPFGALGLKGLFVLGPRVSRGPKGNLARVTGPETREMW